MSGRSFGNRGASRAGLVFLSAVATLLVMGIAAWRVGLGARRADKPDYNPKEILVVGTPLAAAVPEPKLPELAPPDGRKPAEVVPPPDSDSADYSDLGWDVLAGFEYAPPMVNSDGKCIVGRLDAIPSEIKRNNGRKVAVLGYMLPMEMTDDNKMKVFMLMRAPVQCCYAVPPRPNDWMVVTMAPRSDPVEGDYHQVIVSGTLEVGEKFRDGYVESIYRINAAKVEVAE